MERPKVAWIKASDLAHHPSEKRARKVAEQAVCESQRQQEESFWAFMTGLPERPPPKRARAK